MLLLHEQSNLCNFIYFAFIFFFVPFFQTTEQYTFACGNQTVFNQFSLTCDYEEDAVPCAQSSQFYYLNDLIGQEDAKLHSEQDIERAAQYGSRILTARVNAAADAPVTETPTSTSAPPRRRPSGSRRVQSNP